MLTMLTVAVTAFAAVPASAASPATSRQNTGDAAPGGSVYGETAPADTPTVPGSVAQIVDGVAYAPEDAPDAVKQVIWAGNEIVGKPYVYGGGHGDFKDDGYDCSGTVSYALHGGDLLAQPRDSSSFFRYGSAGKGSWIAIYTNSGHMYMTVAGIRLDTSAADDRGGLKGPRWRPLRISDKGFRVRHPVGL
jgi:cell wall-associated NlpC family hydrolase